MDFTRPLRIERSWARRLTGLAMLLGVCASLIPLPVLTFATGGKDRSRPFPCQDRPCGCRSAEQCWKKCCCFTDSQKVAWAKSQGVKAPAFVIAAAAKEQPAAVCRTGGCEKCRQASQQLPETAAEAAASNRKPSRQVVVIALMQKCQGGSWFWNSLPWSTPVVLPDTRIAVPEPSCWEPIVSDCLDDTELPPPVPPPRCAPAALAG